MAKRCKRGAARVFYHETVLTYDGDECLTWPFSTNGGYGQLNLTGQPELVSRLVCAVAHGSPPTPKHHAAHSCGRGNFGCVAKRHLSWKTPAENEADKRDHGTYETRITNAKLTMDDVRQIRALAGTMIHKDIAARFGVSRENIGCIIRGKSWREPVQ